MANAHESFWKAVQQEPPNELGGLQAHEPLVVGVAVIFITKGDLSVFQANQPPVGDGHPVSVSGQILEYLLRGAKRRFAVDHPLGLAESADQRIPVSGKPQRGKAPISKKDLIKLYN